MAVVSGLLCVPGRRAARLGFVTELLSKPIRHGYMNGIALTVHGQPIAHAVRLLGSSGEGVLEQARHSCRRCWRGAPTSPYWRWGSARWGPDLLLQAQPGACRVC
jgi:hypothetical protein